MLSSHSKTRRSLFRPCIDLHGGQVKQIVGGTLSDVNPEALKTNFVASKSSAEFAQLYKVHGLTGGHVIKLGAGNDGAAREALAAWPGGLQIGGGVDNKNAKEWIDAGASKVIITSFLFPGGKFNMDRLKAIETAVGKDRVVVDVSCRRREGKWLVAMNKWQDITDMEVCQESLNMLSEHCRCDEHRIAHDPYPYVYSEFLIHAADVEGLCKGIDEELVEKLGQWVQIPTTYAGGAKDIADLDLVDKLSNGKVDLTYGSSLDIFGGELVKFDELVERNKKALSG
ncbi:Phosphoribosylformimino-5-aminoimidazole carboxamide ribotide isomerase [Neolentinus lepideus HHB14362 ss-1]|uniref:1-(5-phosphoribosyl)-5-[(5-phosphoribosylamino)methylideneamino] imidazole-4-carboxamide isomerase n=1 Tax=Neolentinus lepideus HHB14362 ss-1 TaxID=1314782 RepID=A0A165S0F2_9AGAM|nr:Phosphoribosylformimino-5-aminoimidazole carboxamide ribotide isomerase [Neolentinus lepideus HHB14362 ss-1]